jgi:hypothetical protein
VRFAPLTFITEPRRQWQRSSAAMGSHANMALLHDDGDEAGGDSGTQQ